MHSERFYKFVKFVFYILIIFSAWKPLTDLNVKELHEN